MTLYEINQSILSCIDSETGEVVDPEKLDALMLDRDTKLENVALWIKNLEADAVALKAEKEAFAARQKAAEAKIDSLKKYLAFVLQGEKFSTTRCAVSFRPSKQVLITDESAIPEKYLAKSVSYKPDKAAIKNAIESGLKVEGANVVINLNPQIK